MVGLAVDGAGGVHQHALGRPGHRGRPAHRPGAHDDRADTVERRSVEPEGEQAGVAGDERAHLVGQLEAARRLPPLGAQQLVGELAQAVTLGAVEERPVRRTGGEDVPPPGGQTRTVPGEEPVHRVDSIVRPVPTAGCAPG